MASSGLLTKTLYVVYSPIHATCPTYLTLLDLITLTILCKQQLMTLHIILTPNILLGTLFSNTIGLCSYLNVTGKASLTPIQNSRKLMLIIFSPLYSQTANGKTTHSRPNGSRCSPNSTCSLISSCMQFRFARVIHKYIKLHQQY